MHAAWPRSFTLNDEVVDFLCAKEGAQGKVVFTIRKREKLSTSAISLQNTDFRNIKLQKVAMNRTKKVYL